MGCNCGKPKCKGQCGCKSPAVLQINNPSNYVTFHKVNVPAAMGDSTTNPPAVGKYRNVLLYYEADQTSWLYSTDGIPTNVTGHIGPVGPQGPAGTIQIGTTTTGATGEDASVENVGTPENAILNFVIPRGEQGEQGIQGETGPQGYMNEQDVRDVVDTIVPEDFFINTDKDSDCGKVGEIEKIDNQTALNLSITGGAKQNVYSGANLYNYKDTNSVSPRYTVGDDGWVTCTLSTASSSMIDCTYYTNNLPLSTSTRYAVVLEIKNVSGSGKLAVYSRWAGHAEGQFTTEQMTNFSSMNGNRVIVYKPTTSATFNYNLGLRTYTRFEPGNTGSITFRLSVLADTTVTPASFRYEPFTNQTLSPNPEYPQDLITVSGEQGIVVSGKNLFDKDNAEIRAGYFSGAGIISGDTTSPYANKDKWFFIPCAPSTTYTITKPATATLSSNRFRIGTASDVPRNGDQLSNLWNAGDGTSTSVKTYTTAANAKYLCVFYGTGSTTDDVMPDVLNGVQIEVGSSASAYEAYSSETYTIDLGDISLAEIPSGDGYSDRIYRDATGWRLHKEVGSMTKDAEVYAINGSSSGANETSSDGAFSIDESPWGSSYYANTLGAAVYSSNLGVYDDSQAIATNVAANSMTDGTFVQRDGTNDRTYFRNTAFTGKTGAEVRATMLAKSGGTKIWYPLSSASDTPLSDPSLISQLENIRLHTGINSFLLKNDSGLGSMCIGGYEYGWSGTISEMKQDVDDLEKKVDMNVQYIFPKFWTDSYSGDCNLIKYNGLNILIDCQDTPMWTNVKKLLDDNNVSHLDIMVITHYHRDHNGNFNNLVNNGYIDSDTMMYLPAPVETFGDDFINANINTKATCDAHSIPYRTPDEGERIQIGDELFFTFLNCDKDIIDAYEQKYQNSVSICIFIEYRNTRAFFAGDAGAAVFRRLREAGYPKYRVDLYKMGHHGIDRRTDPKFIHLLSPTLAVQPSGIRDAIKNNYGICEDTAVLKEIGTKIIPYHMQEDYIRINSDGSNTECVSGKVFGTSDQRISLTYYVDKSVSISDYQDGTADHPFSELMQAIASIPFKNALDVTINVAAGYYGKAHESEAQKNCITINNNTDVRITINGDSEDRTAVVLNHVVAYHSHVTFNNLTLDVDNGDALYIYSSEVYLNNIAIKSNTDTLSTAHSGVIMRDNSYIRANQVRIEQCNECIIGTQHSIFCVYSNLEIGTHNSSIFNLAHDATILTPNNVTFDDPTDKANVKNYGLNLRADVRIDNTHADYDQTVTLAHSASGFAWIEIYYKTNDGRRGSTGKIYSPNGTMAFAMVPHLADDGTLYNKQCTFSISGTSVAITQSLQIHYVSGSAPTFTQSTSYFGIEKVIGGYATDYVNVTS